MQAIIDETVITGIQTNLGLLAQILKCHSNAAFGQLVG